jgi:hypothetical protein
LTVLAFATFTPKWPLLDLVSFSFQGSRRAKFAQQVQEEAWITPNDVDQKG